MLSVISAPASLLGFVQILVKSGLFMKTHSDGQTGLTGA
jgi:hypothetical protein